MPFYWVYFPMKIRSDGVWDGSIQLFTWLFAASILTWVVYDLIGEDLIGIETIKERVAVFSAKIRTRFGWQKGKHPVLLKMVWGMEFLFCSWQFFPTLALLCMRKGGVKGMPIYEILMLCASSLFSTVVWTLYSAGVLQVDFKGIVSTLKNCIGVL